MRAFIVSAFVLCTPFATPAQTVVCAGYPGPSIVFDQARERLMTFSQGRTLEWDGTSWGLGATVTDVLTAPIYHPPSRCVVGTRQGRLRAFDGHGFHDLGPLPWGANDAELAYDYWQGRLLALPYSPTAGITLWSWSGTAWQQLPSPGFPVSVHGARATYDILAHRLVAHALCAPPVQGVTIEFDGTSWGQPTFSPVRSGPLAYDFAGQSVIGLLEDGTYRWNGAVWSKVDNTLARGWMLTSDPVGRRVFVLPYQSANSPHAMVWDGATWRPILGQFPGSAGANITFDIARDRATMLGTNAQSEWDGTQWHDISGLGGPMPRLYFGQVYDAARQETIVFGGNVTSPTSRVQMGDTWAWNGQWRLAATSGPSPRYEPSVCYDSGRQRVLLVGGTQDAGPSFADHWEWDGNLWTLVHPATPMGPIPGGIGYDPVRARALFVDRLGITWDYDGSTWRQLAVGAVVHSTGELTWDSQRQRLIGSLAAPQQAPQRFEWDTQQWQPIAGNPGLVCHYPLRGILLDYNSNRLQHDSPTPAVVAEFGQGCGGNGIGTTLTPFGRPTPGNSEFHLDLRAEAGQQPALLGFGSGSASIPLGNGCALLLSGSFAGRLGFTNALGALHAAVPLPHNLSLAGGSFTAQAAVLDPASPGGIALTQGLHVIVGH